MPRHLYPTIINYGLNSLFFILFACPLQGMASDESNQFDPLVVSPDRFELLLENDFVRVLEYQLAPGETDGWHTHPAKVSYVLSAGRLRIHLENGEHFEVDEELDTASWSGALGKHYAENIGSSVVRILLVEPKNAVSESTVGLK